MSVLITGAGGFIGYHLSDRLLQEGLNVVAIDNLSVRADQHFQNLRIAKLKAYPNFIFYQGDILDMPFLVHLFQQNSFVSVIHLSAKTGIKTSQIYPADYLQTNVIGFHNVLKLSQETECKKFIFASSSSIYGKTTQLPFTEQSPHPPALSIYAATKQTNETIGNIYAQQGSMAIIGLRLFTVYGNYYRSDMALSKFAKAITSRQTVYISGNGEVKRDFTHVSDVVEVIWRLLQRETAQKTNSSEIFNVGYGRSIALTRVVELMADYLGIKPEIAFQPLAPAELPVTYADIRKLKQAINYSPQVPIEQGIKLFLDWYSDPQT